MKKQKKTFLLIIPILIAVLLVGGGLLLFREEPAPADLPTSTQTGAYAPDFTVYDEKGNAKKLSDYRGKPVVLNFWATWCGPCVRELPHFQDRHNNLGKDVQFLMVNLTDGTQETIAGVKSFMEAMGYDFPVLYDTASNASTVFNVRSIPTTYFIDENGVIVSSATVSLSAQQLQRGIDMIVK